MNNKINYKIKGQTHNVFKDKKLIVAQLVENHLNKLID